MEIVLREFLPKDALDVVNLNNRVWRVCYSHIFPTEVFDDREAKTYERAEKLVSDPQNDEMWVAEADGIIVGMMYFLYQSKIEQFARGKCGDLTVLYVDNNCQRAGVGRKLFELCKNKLKEKNVKSFVVGVLKENHIGRNAYEKWGGELTGYETGFVKLGVSYPEVFYQFKV